MNFESIVESYKRSRQYHRTFPLLDFAVLCVMASEPDRAIPKKEIADRLETTYMNVWNAHRRLEWGGLVLGNRLSERGRWAMGLDDVDEAVACGPDGRSARGVDLPDPDLPPTQPEAVDGAEQHEELF